jgi:hypothetical protein
VTSLVKVVMGSRLRTNLDLWLPFPQELEPAQNVRRRTTQSSPGFDATDRTHRPRSSALPGPGGGAAATGQAVWAS